MVRMVWHSFLAFETLGLLLHCFRIADSQRTYQRSCDCEYTVDGKCAYTLLLPSGGGSQSSTCPTGSGNGNFTAAFESFAQEVRKNISDLESYTGEQAKAIVYLQNTVDQHGKDIANIANGSGKNATSGCDGCPGIANDISGHETRISALEKEVAQLSELVASLVRQVASLMASNMTVVNSQTTQQTSNPSTSSETIRTISLATSQGTRSPLSSPTSTRAASPISPSSLQQTAGTISPFTIQQTVGPISPFSIQQTVGPISPSSLQQTAGTISPSSIQQTAGPSLPFSIQQTVGPISPFSIQQTVGPISPSSIQQTVGPSSPSSFQQTSNSVDIRTPTLQTILSSATSTFEQTTDGSFPTLTQGGSSNSTGWTSLPNGPTSDGSMLTPVEVSPNDTNAWTSLNISSVSTKSPTNISSVDAGTTSLTSTSFVVSPSETVNSSDTVTSNSVSDAYVSDTVTRYTVTSISASVQLTQGLHLTSASNESSNVSSTVTTLLPSSSSVSSSLYPSNLDQTNTTVTSSQTNYPSNDTHVHIDFSTTTYSPSPLTDNSSRINATSYMLVESRSSSQIGIHPVMSTLPGGDTGKHTNSVGDTVHSDQTGVTTSSNNTKPEVSNDTTPNYGPSTTVSGDKSNEVSNSANHEWPTIGVQSTSPSANLNQTYADLVTMPSLRTLIYSGRAGSDVSQDLHVSATQNSGAVLTESVYQTGQNRSDVSSTRSPYAETSRLELFSSNETNGNNTVPTLPGSRQLTTAPQLNSSPLLTMAQQLSNDSGSVTTISQSQTLIISSRSASRSNI